MTDTPLTIAVIGRGLIGAAAARHLCKTLHEVILIGPGEPAEKATHTGVFASHYDEGRITRRLATDPFWARVSAASIDRYAQIEAESDIAFFTACGAMMAGPVNSTFAKAFEAVRQTCTPEAQTLDRAALARRFPWFAFPSDFVAAYEPTGAGHVSPRRLVAAQSEAARRHGARILDSEVTAIRDTGTGIAIDTGQGPITADCALVATGGMTDHLLPAPLGLTVKARTVVFFGIDDTEAARLANMPCLVFRWTGAGEPYLLPPIRYPDGRTYLKLGGDPVDVELTTAARIGDWFRSGGDPSVRTHLTNLMRGLMPDLKIDSIHMEPCITTYTRSGKPVIDRVSPRLAVATGGNGAGAKCSDELGRLGAMALLGDDDPQLSHTRSAKDVLT